MPISRRAYRRVLPGLLSLWIVFCKDPTDSLKVWLTLSAAKSNYLQFVKEAYSSAYWDDERRSRNRVAIIDRLAANHLDFIIAMGTWAGQDLADNQHSVPTMVVSTGDPIKSGIVKSAARSGSDHVHAKCNPQRYLWQLRLFHDIIGFKRLGIVYEHTDVGKTYAAISDVERVASRRGFTLVPCEARWSGVPRQVRTREVIECHEQLAPQIDALFMTVHAGIDANHMNELLAPLLAHKIPTWSQRELQEVRHGVLLSISRKGFEAVGLFHAFIMARNFNGAKPGNLNQIFEDPKHIAINLKTAKAIGFNAPKGLLKAADTIYR
jgi:ABC-type uncharacterized transport system substrate-binding protein